MFPNGSARHAHGLALLYVIVVLMVMMVAFSALLKLLLYGKTAEAGVTTRQSGNDAAVACYNEYLANQGGNIQTSGAFTNYICSNGAVISSTSTAAPYFLAISTTTKS
jgi:hypothetical protein